MVQENNRVPKKAIETIDKADAVEVVEHKFDAVVTSGVSVKKNSGIGKFFRQLFADDMETVKDTFKKDVLLPIVQDGISGILHEAVDLLIPGTRKYSRNSSSRGLFSSMKTLNREKYYSSSIDSSRISTSRDDDSVEVCADNLLKFDSRRKAETVLDAMSEALDRFPAVSVADLYDLAGVSNLVGDFTDKNWGWTSLLGTKVRRARGGGYYLDLPRVEDIRDVR